MVWAVLVAGRSTFVYQLRMGAPAPAADLGSSQLISLPRTLAHAPKQRQQQSCLDQLVAPAGTRM